MVLKKLKYLSCNVPVSILDNLGVDYGSTVSKVGAIDDVSMFICALCDRKPQCLISNCSTTTPGSEKHRVVKEGDMSRLVTIIRPCVFDDYHMAKERDNMPFYHDFIRCKDWQMYAVAYFLAAAEANAYLVWRSFVPASVSTVGHSTSRGKLATELISYYFASSSLLEDMNDNDDSNHTGVQHVPGLLAMKPGKKISSSAEVCGVRQNN
ncbi:hypothetical protein BDA99DRAFT_589987 [Phascolomyces articulosus]|uniref:PiggyBac transposable element-derived protein domain-containing protein n=1 Tax=Phascolomyces articulosus TaxID=60185 RepID=A0AAD5K081_9FUNG|nr:hypothetical protein BDA99DRAFT_589987 [Phascolomyces articulosus]